MKLLTSLCLIAAVLMATVGNTYAQTNRSFWIHALTNEGKKSKEAAAAILFGEQSVQIKSNKAGVLDKTFVYSEIKAVEYSYSKKPLLSTGGAVAMAILTGLVVVPFLLVKKKQHWLTVRDDKDYVVMRLDKKNYRQIQSEFEVKNIKVETISEDKK